LADALGRNPKINRLSLAKGFIQGFPAFRSMEDKVTSKTSEEPEPTRLNTADRPPVQSRML